MKKNQEQFIRHCYGHSLNLACNDTIRQCQLIRNAFDTAQEITNLVKKSPRRDALLSRLKHELALPSPGIRALCPTRWTTNAECLGKILSNYEVLFTLWEESLQYVKETDMKCRIIGVKACMVSFDFLFGLMLGQLLLHHSDNLSQTLQSLSMSAAEGQCVAAMTVKTLQSLRSEENFAAFWERVYQTASELEVEYLTLPRKRRPCRQYDSGSSEGDHPGNVQDMYRRIFFEALLRPDNL